MAKDDQDAVAAFEQDGFRLYYFKSYAEILIGADWDLSLQIEGS